MAKFLGKICVLGLQSPFPLSEKHISQNRKCVGILRNILSVNPPWSQNTTTSFSVLSLLSILLWNLWCDQGLPVWSSLYYYKTAPNMENLPSARYSSNHFPCNAHYYFFEYNLFVSQFIDEETEGQSCSIDWLRSHNLNQGKEYSQNSLSSLNSQPVLSNNPQHCLPLNLSSENWKSKYYLSVFSLLDFLWFSKICQVLWNLSKCFLANWKASPGSMRLNSFRMTGSLTTLLSYICVIFFSLYSISLTEMPQSKCHSFWESSSSQADFDFFGLYFTWVLYSPLLI